MKRYSADAVMAGLKDFQQRTVEHVIGRFHGSEQTRRFLVADETGLGKSVIARGVIARTLEILQDDDNVERIDVIYVCSNQDIAAQNLARLKVTSGESVTLSSRLTLLARHSAALNAAEASEGKRVNLVAFTPGTSFDKGWSTGTAVERALLFLLLEAMSDWDGWERRAAIRALQGTVTSADGFTRRIDGLRKELSAGIDQRISRVFQQLIQGSGQRQEFAALLADVGRRRTLPDDLRRRSFELTGRLRTSLARAGVETLEPDLVILDEFQRFRHLLSAEEGGESAELAHELFNYGAAKVLLLSATPYKPFTLAEESAAGDDHWQDFRQVLRFLCERPEWSAQIDEGLRSYREAVVQGVADESNRASLRGLLLQAMCRTERPVLGQDGMLDERRLDARDIRSDDVRGYAIMRRLADTLDAPVNLEYWKSAPYFLNFTEGYKLGTELRSALRDRSRGDLMQLLTSAQLLDPAKLKEHQEIDLGNARLRRLAADTLDRGWWRLLWVPPSMPHYQLGEPFASAATAGMTKRLLFSSWTATPAAVAGLLSYEVERRLHANVPPERRRVTARLEYRLESGRPSGMSTLAMFWPNPALARLCDPLKAARQTPNELVPLALIERHLQEQVSASAPADADSPTRQEETSPWETFLRWPGTQLPEDLTADAATVVLSGQSEEPDEVGAGLRLHVNHAIEIAAEQQHLPASLTETLTADVVALGMHAPGNVAWRAIDRLREQGWAVTEAGHWRAAALLASGLRSLFNRPDSILLLDQLDLDPVYWRAVLRYCAAGGLQALLDEYLHHLRSALSDLPLTDDTLHDLAQEASDALALRPSTYRAFDPRQPDTTIGLTSRFALRYGGRNDDVQGSRPPEVRKAFNSPFWPFVLATTSAGQEGIDFHWWCSALVHWNTPSNPVDFEQREGRVHRFGGHAVRRNVATKHRAEALASEAADVWKAAYDAARRQSAHLGDFAPYWIYPGEAKIERQLMPYPLSRDLPKIQQLKQDLVMYRLAFGQPRQEDLIALLHRNTTDQTETANLTLDLKP